MKTLPGGKALVEILLCAWIARVNAVTLPQVWNARASPSSNQLNAVAYGNGVFVAVGDHATILTSPNGIHWTARSAGTTIPTLVGAAWGEGRYVVGGGEDALIRSSANAIDWTNGLSTIGTEHVNGVVFGYGEFVAVGTVIGGGTQFYVGYILTSSNGLDWISRSAPTTNMLFGISPAYAEGIGWADLLYVAVGDHGTILTSTNGVNWTPRNSGTTVPLRSVVWQEGFRVGGDYGTILVSPDGITWTAAAPASFHVRGLATSGLGGAVVAAGESSNQGRLHASADGLTWPGFALQFPNVLNGVAYGGGSFVAVGNDGLILQSVVSPPPPLTFARTTDGLVLSWPGAYELVTATNIGDPYLAIPGASSPWTNRFTGAQRYFRLRAPGP